MYRMKPMMVSDMRKMSYFARAGAVRSGVALHGLGLNFEWDTAGILKDVPSGSAADASRAVTFEPETIVGDTVNRGPGPWKDTYVFSPSTPAPAGNSIWETLIGRFAAAFNAPQPVPAKPDVGMSKMVWIAALGLGAAGALYGIAKKKPAITVLAIAGGVTGAIVAKESL